MLWRGDVAPEEDVFGPGEILRILRPADDELRPWAPPCRFQEKRLELVLPVSGISAEIGKRGERAFRSWRGGIPLDIDTAIERRHAAGAQTFGKRGQRFP